MTNFNISTLATTLAEGGIYSFSITPKTALTEAVTVRWEILAKGKLPISADDFASFTGVVDFAAQATVAQTVRITPTDDAALEAAQNFQIRIYQVVTGGDDILLGEQAVRLDDNDIPTPTTPPTPSLFGESAPASNAEGNVNTAANTQDFALNAKGGNDTYIITRYQSGDVKIAESAGIDLIKFDFGVEIARFGEVSTSNFTRLKIEATILTLSTGAKIEIEFPDRSTSFQLGDGEIITSYAAFKTAIGASGTNATATFIAESYEVTTFATTPDVSANTIEVAAEVLESTGSSDVIGLGSVADVRANGAGGDDTFVITRFQSGDVEIDDTVGTNLIKFDFGVSITDFAETSRISFGELTVSLATLTLSTGAEIEISFPAGAFRFQLGDATVIETYAAFKTAIDATGTNAASTLPNTYKIVHSSENSPTTGAVTIDYADTATPKTMPNVGEVLTANTSALTDADDPTLTFTYQWKLGGADITGATASTHKATATGAYTVTVIATDSVTSTPTTFTAATATTVVAAVNVAPVNLPIVTSDAPSSVTIQGIVITTKAGVTVNALKLSVTNSTGNNFAVSNSGGTWRIAFNSNEASENTLADIFSGLRAHSTFVSKFAVTTDENYNGGVSSTILNPLTSNLDNPTNLNFKPAAKVGAVLTADASAITDGDGLPSISTYTYQWLRAGAEISGASAKTYTLKADDIGAPITVRVTYTDAKGSTEILTSIAIDTETTGAVTITHAENSAPTDMANTGETLTAVLTDFADVDDDTLTFTYQWQKDGADITTATAATYTPTAKGAYTVTVTATDSVNNVATTFTPATAIDVIPTNNLPTGGVTITGTYASSEILTAVSTIGDADGLGTFSYQWLRGGAEISGATASTYTQVAADTGKAITVRVTYTDGKGTFETATSVIAVDASTPAFATALGIIFTAKAGGLANLDTKIILKAAAEAGDSTFSASDNTLTIPHVVSVELAQTIFDRLLVDSDATDNFIITKVADFYGAGTSFRAQEHQLATSYVLEDTPGVDAIGHFIATPEATDTIIGYGVQTQGTYGTVTIDLSGKWAYVVNNDHAVVNALGENDSLRDTILLSATESDGDVINHEITIHIDGRSDITGTSRGDTLGSSVQGRDLTLRAKEGSDTIELASGDYVVIGGEGTTDTINIGSGTATIIYRFDSSATRLVGTDGRDTISDFKAGVDKFVFADVDTTTPIDTLAKLQAADNADSSFNVSFAVGSSGTTLGKITSITIFFRVTITFDTTDPSSLITAADVSAKTSGTQITNLSLLDTLFGTGNFQITPVADLGVNIEPDNNAPTGAVTVETPITTNIHGIVITSKEGVLVPDGFKLTSANSTGRGVVTIDYTSSSNTWSINFNSEEAVSDTLGDILTGLRAQKTFTDRFDVTTDASYDEDASSALLVASNSGASANHPFTSIPPTTGTALTADASALRDTDGLDAFSYQWLRGGEEISGAESVAYTLVAADVGKIITVRVSYTDDRGNAESVTSVVATDTPTTGTVSIDHIEKSSPSNAANIGETLTAVTSALTDANDHELTFTYQWKFNGVNIENGRGIAATHKAKAVGEYSVVVTATDDVNNVKTDFTSAATSVVANNNVPTGGVTVSSVTTTGGSSVNIHGLLFTLKADAANANAQTKISFLNSTSGNIFNPRFYDSDTLFQIEFNNGFAGHDTLGEILALLQGHTAVINNFVVTEGAGYDVSADSVVLDATGGVSTRHNLVTTSGGTTLTANTATLADADGLPATSTFTYQWLRGGADISGAESATYTLVAGDVGKPITVRVSYTDGAGLAESVTSIVVDTPTTGTVTITAGDTLLPTNTANAANIGETLTAVASAFTDANDHTLTLSYQWKLGGANITGATSTTYVPSAIGSYTFAVTAHDDVNNVSKIFTSAAITITAATNVAPVLTIDDTEIGATHTYNFVENAITAIDVSATDANPFDTLSYELITGGADNAKFNIDATTGALSFISPPDFENPTDAGANNDYAVKVKVSDGTLSDTADITVRVTAVDEGDAIFAVTGKALVGEALTASVTTADIDVVTAAGYSYQWQVQAGGAGAWANIANATASTYTLTAAELGDALRVKVSYTDKSSTAENVISTPSAVVATILVPDAGTYTTLTGTAGDDTFTLGSENTLIRGLAGGDTINTGAGKSVVIGGAGADTINIGSGAAIIIQRFSSSTAQLSGEGGFDGTNNFKRGVDKLVLVDTDTASAITTVAAFATAHGAGGLSKVFFSVGTSGATNGKITDVDIRLDSGSVMRITFDASDPTNLMNISDIAGKYNGELLTDLSVLGDLFGAGSLNVVAEANLGFPLDFAVNVAGYGVELGTAAANTQNDAAGTGNKVFQGAGGADIISTGTGINVIIGGTGKDDINLKNAAGTDTIIHRFASSGTAWVNSDGADDIDAFQINTDKFVFVDTDATALTNTADFLAGLAAGGAKAQITTITGGGNYENKITVLKVKFGTESEYLTINFNGDDGGANLVDHTTLESGLTVAAGETLVFDVTDFAIFDDLFGANGFSVVGAGDLGVGFAPDRGALISTTGLTAVTGTAGADTTTLDQAAATVNQLIQGGGGADTISSGTGTNVMTGGTGKDTINLKSGAGTDTVIHRLASSGTTWTNSDGADTIHNFQRGVDKLVFADTDGTAITNVTDLLAGLGTSGIEGRVTSLVAGSVGFGDKIVTLEIRFGTSGDYLTIKFDGFAGGSSLQTSESVVRGLTATSTLPNGSVIHKITDFAILDDLFGANSLDVVDVDYLGVTIL